MIYFIMDPLSRMIPMPISYADAVSFGTPTLTLTMDSGGIDAVGGPFEYLESSRPHPSCT